MIKKIQIFLILFIISTVSMASTGTYIFDHISRKDGLLNSSVSSIVQDKDGFMWVGTQGGLNRFDGINFKKYEHDPYDSSSLPHSLIQTMHLDYEKNVLWIGTYNGLAKFEIYTEKFTHYSNDPNTENPLSNEVVTAITVGDDGKIWIGTLDGLNVLDQSTGEIKQYFQDENDPGSLSNNTVRSLLSDSKGRVWVGTYNGLNLYNKLEDNFISFTPENTKELKSPFIMSLSEDFEGNIWIGNWGEGIVKFLPDKGIFEKSIKTTDNRIYVINAQDNGRIWAGTWGGGLYEYIIDGSLLNEYVYEEDNDGSISHDVVYSICMDSSDLIWIGTNGNGLNKLNKSKIDYRKFSFDPDDPKSLSLGKVNHIMEDISTDLWFGIYDGGLNRYITKEERMISYRYDPTNPNSLSNDIVTFVYQDTHENIWVGTNEGLNLYIRETDSFEEYIPDGTSNNPSGSIPYAMAEDKNGDLWIGYYKNGLDRWNRQTGEFTNYKYNPENPNSLSDNLIYAIICDIDNNIWIATNNGLNRYNTDDDTFTKFFNDLNDRKTLSSDTTRTLFEDSKGRLWIGTSSGGLNLFDKNNGTFQHYNKTNGLSDNVVLAILESDDATIWIATMYGINILDPETGVITLISEEDGLWGMDFNSGHTKTKDGELLFGAIHGVYSFNNSPTIVNLYKPTIQIVDILIMNSPLISDNPYYKLKEIELPYNSNFLSFEFVSMDYHAPSKNQYAYKLEGVDKDWIYTGNRNFANYSNLSSGQYEFLIKASNSDGDWNDIPRVLTVVINPPPWKTWWAWLIYIFLFGCLAWIAKKGMDLSLKKKNAEISSKAKSDFLANMSHEIRTPLNSIIGFTNLLDKTTLNKNQRQYLGSVNSSAHSLLGIINDILDLSKIEAGKLDLEILKTDLFDIIGESIEVVSFMASEKNLELLLNIQPDMPKYLFTDPTRLKQILINLLNNAIKFTETGEIELIVSFDRLTTENGTFRFCVRDTGIGISPEHMKKLFISFSQADSSITRRFGGSGLGLSICNLLVKKLGGTLETTSVLNSGSEFSFSINSDYDALNWISQEHIRIASKVMIVDENRSNLKIMKKLFDHLNINCDTCANADELFEKLSENTDYGLMIIKYEMEQMDGISLLEEVISRGFNLSKDIKIIMINSHINNEKVDQAAQAVGLDCSLMKPLQYKDLIKCLSEKEDKKREIEYEKRLYFNEPKKILIAEDVQMNMLLFKTIIRQFIDNAEITEAFDGKQAYEYATNNHYDLILMDVRMPTMDGIEATKKIRMFEKSRDYHIPIVALTANAVNAEREKCLKAGMDDFLTKPIDNERLFDTLSEFLKPEEIVSFKDSKKKEEHIEEQVHFDRLNLLRKINFDTPTFVEIINIAVTDLDDRVNALEVAIKNEDYDEIKNASHSIKGTASEIFFVELSKIAKAMEKQFNDIGFVSKKQQHLLEEWNHLKKLLEAENKTK